MKISIECGYHSQPPSNSGAHDRVPTLPGDAVNIGNTSVRLESIRQHRAIDIPAVLEFVIDTSVTVEVGLITNWLYEHFKERPARLQIEQREVKIDKDAIEKALGAALRNLDKKK